MIISNLIQVHGSLLQYRYIYIAGIIVDIEVPFLSIAMEITTVKALL